MPEPVEGVKVFYSYSHADEAFRQQLENHLAILRRKGVISEWHDRRIPPGSVWKDEIDRALEEAEVVLLLVSSDFLASDYCYEVEVQRAIDRHKKGEAVVISVILRPCDFHDSPLGGLQALPPDAIPVSRFDDQDEAWLSVARGIKGICEQLLATRMNAPSDAAKIVDVHEASAPDSQEEDFGILDFMAELEAAMEQMTATQQAISAHTEEVTHTLVEGTGEASRLQAIRPADGARKARWIAGKMAASLAGYGKAMEQRAGELANAWNKVQRYFPRMLEHVEPADAESRTELRVLVTAIAGAEEAMAEAKQSAIEAKKSMAGLAQYSASLKLGVRRAEQGIQRVIDEYWTVETALQNMRRQIPELLDEERHYPLRGKPLHYEDPTVPVGESDWQALQ